MAKRIAYYAPDRDTEELCVPILKCYYDAQVHEITDNPSLRGYKGIYVTEDKAKAATELLKSLISIIQSHIQ
jgi:hypothetical protein